MPEALCGNCEFYVGTMKRGKCRLNTPGQDSYERRFNAWPACSYDAWCGKWQAIGAPLSVRVRIPGDMNPPRPGPLR